MNLFKKTLLSLAFALSAGAANAEVITDTVSYSANPVISSANPLLFIHDITDGSNPYVVNLDQIISALLTITLVDPSGDNENFTFVIGSSAQAQTAEGKNINNGTQQAYPFTLDPVSLNDLNDDGKLSVSLTAQSGNFQFVNSTLSATVQRATPANAVPEPASAALLGLGLLAVASIRRKFAGK